MKSAVVYVKGIEAGILAKFRNGTYEFRYTSRYRRDTRTKSVAYTLSKKAAMYRSPHLFAYFYGLLAEGSQKALQCREMKIDERDHFTRLVETCGEGVIGAVCVKPRKRREERSGRA